MLEFNERFPRSAKALDLVLQLVLGMIAFAFCGGLLISIVQMVASLIGDYMPLFIQAFYAVLVIVQIMLSWFV